jgi:hypothetical protein
MSPTVLPAFSLAWSIRGAQYTNCVSKSGLVGAPDECFCIQRYVPFAQITMSAGKYVALSVQKLVCLVDCTSIFQ